MKHVYMTKRKHPDDGPSYEERLRDYIAKGKVKDNEIMEDPIREMNRLKSNKYSKILT